MAILTPKGVKAPHQLKGVRKVRISRDRRGAGSEEKSDIEELQLQVADIEDELDTKVDKKNPNERVVICVGDSYNKNTDWWDGWGKCLKDISGFTVYSYEAGGGGFVANTYQYDFLGALQNHSQDDECTDKESVTDIVVLGGYNDVSVGATDEALRTAMSTFITYCKTNYPNARITIAGIAFDYNSVSNQRKVNTMNMKYSQFATELGVSTHPHFKYILQAKSLVFFMEGNANSGFHPSTTGNEQVANCLAQYLLNGTFDVRYGYVIADAFVYRQNDTVKIMSRPADNYQHPNGETIFEPLFTGKTLPFNTWVDLGSLEDVSGECLLWGAEPGLEATWFAYTFTTTTLSGQESNINGIVVFKIIDKHLYVNNVGNTRSLVIGTDDYISIPGTLTFDWQEIM